MADQELGVALIVVGVVIMVVAIFGGPISGAICALGLVLLIVGIVLAASQRPAVPYYYPQPGYGTPGYPPQPYPAQQPVAGAPAPGAPSAPGTPFQTPACYVCGTALTWVPQYGRWYCGRCQSYR